MSEEKLQNLVEEYANLAKDKKVDATALMINALQQEDATRVSSKTKRWVYLISIGLPPVGYLFTLWFYFREESDAKTLAYVCAGLTTFSLILSIFFFQAVLKSSGTSVEQIQQIKPADVYQLTQ